MLISGTQPQLTLQYQLGVTSPQQLNVLSPAVVQAVVTTSEKADIAVAKEKADEVSVADASTDTSIDKSTSPDATNGSTTLTLAVPKTETKVTTVYEPGSKEFKREYSASSTLFPYESYAGDSESATELSKLFSSEATKNINKLYDEKTEQYSKDKQVLFMKKLTQENLVKQYQTLLFSPETN